MIDAVRARQIRTRLTEIRDELATLAAELDGGAEAETPGQRRRAFRVYDGGARLDIDGAA